MDDVEVDLDQDTRKFSSLGGCVLNSLAARCISLGHMICSKQ